MQTTSDTDDQIDDDRLDSILACLFRGCRFAPRIPQFRGYLGTTAQAPDTQAPAPPRPR